jgi:hypothetical protein
MRAYDLATVCKWIGNSPEVAARHYAVSIDLNADFQRATGLPDAQQKAQQSATSNDCQGGTKTPNDPAKSGKERRIDGCRTPLTFPVTAGEVGAVGFEPTRPKPSDWQSDHLHRSARDSPGQETSLPVGGGPTC